MKKVYLSVIFLGLTGHIFAQNTEHYYFKGKTEIFTSVSFASEKQINDNNIDWKDSFPFQISHFLFENFSLGFRANVYEIEDVDVTFVSEIDIPVLSNKVIPFIFLGYGYNFKMYDVNFHKDYGIKDISISRLYYVGSGLKIPISIRFSLRADMCCTWKSVNPNENVNNGIISMFNTNKQKKPSLETLNYSLGFSFIL